MQCGICQRSALFVCTDCDKLQCKTLGCENQRLACAGELEQQQALSASMENLAQRVWKLESIVDTLPPPDPPTMTSILSTFELLRPHFPQFQNELDEMVSILGSFKLRLAELGIQPHTPLLKEHFDIGLPVVVRSPTPQTFIAKVATKVSQPWFVLSTIVATLGFVVNALKYTRPEADFKETFGSLATFSFVMNLSLTLIGLLINFTLNDPLQRLLTSPRHLLPAIEEEIKENMIHPANPTHAVVVRRIHVLQVAFEWTDSTMAISRKIDQELNWGLVDREHVTVQVLQNYATAFSGKPMVEIRYFNRHYPT
jgi:hypothetical protein